MYGVLNILNFRQTLVFVGRNTLSISSFRNMNMVATRKLQPMKIFSSVYHRGQTSLQSLLIRRWPMICMSQQTTGIIITPDMMLRGNTLWQITRERIIPLTAAKPPIMCISGKTNIRFLSALHTILIKYKSKIPSVTATRHIPCRNKAGRLYILRQKEMIILSTATIPPAAILSVITALCFCICYVIL